MSHKYKILEIHKTDHLFKNKSKRASNILIGKIGVGNPENHPEYLGYHKGGLFLSFIRHVPVYKSKEDENKGIVDHYKDMQSTEYAYFSAVKIERVNN